MAKTALIMGGTGQPVPGAIFDGLDMLAPYLITVSDITRYIFTPPVSFYPAMDIIVIGGDPPDPFLINNLLRDGDYLALLRLLLSGDDILFGTPRDDNLVGLDGNDTFHDTGGADRYDGGSGNNTVVYDADSSSFSIFIGGNGAELVDLSHPLDLDTFANMAFIRFGDMTLDVRTLIKAHQATADQYEDVLDLYVGYLDRAPDAYGLAYWLSRYNDGMSRDDIARSFFASDEAVTLRQPVHTAGELVSKAYRDVLDRTADQAGLDYWVGELESGRLAKDQFALAFVNGASPGSADDQILGVKKVLAGYYALASGLTDATHAAAVMQAANGQAPGSSLDDISAAFALVESYAVAAAQPGSGELTIDVFGSAHPATVHPADVAANRAELVAMIEANLFGLSEPRIASLESDYLERWAQDVSVMFGH